MEENVNRLENPDSEQVDGGCLPDWEVTDLPAPPPYRFLNFRDAAAIFDILTATY